MPTKNNHTESPSGNYHFDGFGCGATDVSVKVNFFAKMYVTPNTYTCSEGDFTLVYANYGEESITGS